MTNRSHLTFRQLLLTAALIALSAAACAANPPVYSSIDYPRSSSTFAAGINDLGQIVGAYDNAHGFLLSQGVYTSIDYPGATQTFALGINRKH